MRASPWVIAFLSFTTVLAGCAQQGDDGSDDPVGPATLRVRDEAGDRVPYASFAYVAPNGSFLAIASADARGTAPLAPVPVGTDHLLFAAPRRIAQNVSLARAAAAPIELRTDANATMPAGFLAFRRPVPLLCPTDPATRAQDAAFQRSCGGFGEAVLEVAGDGTVWASATCCVGRSPPIWVSRDGGNTFSVLKEKDTGVARDSFGIEGDFAIDAAGNVYFFDIGLAVMWFTSYTHEAKHRWTVPVPLPPLVDRPWVRAGVADEVFILYNTGDDTRFYRSTDGGRTWNHAGPAAPFACPLGVLGQGFDPNHLVVVSCDAFPGNASARQSPRDEPKFYESKDGGKTWSAAEDVPLPGGDYDLPRGRAMKFYSPTAIDEAGNVYVVYRHAMDAKAKEIGVFVSRRSPNGTWAGPVAIATQGTNQDPWPVAGARGHLALAWYHTDVDTKVAQRNAVWYLMGAASIDADSAAPHFQTVIADPTPVLWGAYGRELGDFLETRLKPDRGLAVAYGYAQPGDQYEVQNQFVQTAPGFDLGFQRFNNGPKKA